MKFNGVGSASIYKESLPQENYSLRHSCPGVLSAEIDKNNICSSKFNISFRDLKSLDGKNVVFGKVIKGMETLFKVR